MNELVAHLRFALRMLIKSPWMSFAVIAALALGIGANAAIFSVVSAVFFRPLPYPEAERLVQLQTEESPGELNPAFGEATFNFWQRNSTAFSALSVYDIGLQGYALDDGADKEFVQGIRVSRGFFDVFGVQPAIGRAFTAEEDLPGGPRVVILSDGLWRSRFGADRSMLERTVALNGEEYQVVGVMPPSFAHPADAQLWTPLRIDPASQELALYLFMTGRLKPDIELAEARQRIAGTMARFRSAFGIDDEVRVVATPLALFLYGDYRTTLVVMLLAVSAVLLVACANVTNLQLARATGRQHELAVRRSIGASPSVVLRQLIAESVVLALLGAVAGLAVAHALLALFRVLRPAEIAARLPEVVLDWRVLLYTLGISLVVGFLSGLAPAIQAARVDINGLIKDSTTLSPGREGWSGHRLQYSLVVAEVALTLILLVATGLLIKSFSGLVQTPPGFEPVGVEVYKVLVPAERYGTGAGIERLESTLLADLETLPAVRRAALATTVPLERGPSMTFILPDRYDAGSGAGRGVAEHRGVSEDYFDALGIPLLRGRTFDARDAASSSGVVVVNRTAADRFFAGREAVGGFIHIGLPDMPAMADPAPREVIGVVGDVREAGLDKEAPPILYVPLAQIPDSLLSMMVGYGPLTVVMSGDGSATATLERQVRQSASRTDSEILVMGSSSLDEAVSRSVGAPRFNMSLLGTLAGFAFLLAALGIYGILAYLVGRRRREIGVRMALGGEPRAISNLVLRQGMLPVLIGVGLGLVGAFFATGLLRNLVYGVSVSDPSAYVTVTLLVLLVSSLAVYLPARRASRVDPAEVLRPER